jgi:hypothetical protein
MKDSSIAQNAATTAGNTAAGLGAGASSIGSSMVPYLNRQMQNPSGYSQQDIGSMLSSGLAGAGGATSGIYGAAGKGASAMRNPMGFSGALDAAAQSRNQAAAGTSEGISAQNANVKLQQQQQASSELGKMYGTDVSGQNDAAGQVAKDAQIANSMSPLNQVMGIMGQLGGMAGGAGSILSGLNGGGRGCWIAAAVYDGWLDPRTIKVREWIFGPFRSTMLGKVVADIYLKYGERVAKMISLHPILRKPFKKLFDLALQRANGTI